MVFSMTGYGQSAKEIGGYKISIEMKSVNHRYSEIVLRLPREWANLEDRLRRIVQGRIRRGRVDVFINKEHVGETACAVDVNMQVVDAYMQAAKQLSEKYGLSGEIEVMDVLRLPDAVTVSEKTTWSEEQLIACLEDGLTEALEGLYQMRTVEGAHLAQDTKERVARLEVIHGELVEWAPVVVTDYRAKLKQRLEQLSEQHLTFDDTKFGMEVALFAERSNIDEELTRLDSHFQQFKKLLESEEPIGRKLDFLIQEMNRETNTIGSKANHLEIVNRVVEMKAELEKIREQIANME
ncbi:YicC/YloC family endoribonuclease [Paenibacillus aquistagni]|uniref:YicC/YloC family endoribonuclease n=1 Tax=Paenibacillus aquistagni TaxID=1852522 RepID=UPI00145AAE74|nr:YicC/YloC family endoribonuclease [Paenibacillus aquistagni]NMM51360.1 YicC family protein [Paenibacillus aquistagni]